MFESIRRRFGAAAPQQVPASRQTPTMARLLAEIGDHGVPPDLREEIEALDGNWNRSRRAA